MKKKLKVLIEFFDLEEGKKRAAGEIFECEDESRVETLTTKKNAPGIKVCEVIEDENKQRKGTVRGSRKKPDASADSGKSRTAGK